MRFESSRGIQIFLTLPVFWVRWAGAFVVGSVRNRGRRGAVDSAMVVIGCLLLFVLPLIGLVIGGWLGGLTVGLWAASGGLVIAVAACSLSIVALMKARPSR